MSTRGDRRLALGLMLAIVGLALASQLADTRPGGHVAGSVASTAPDGRRALLLLLGELGFPARAWRGRPGALPRGDHVLWLADAPHDAPVEGRERTAGSEAEDEAESPASTREDEAASDTDAEEGEDASDAEADAREADAEPLEAQVPPRDAAPPAYDPHDPAHYARFLDEGGTLILPVDPRTIAFLARVLGADRLGALAQDRTQKGGLYRVRTSAGEELVLETSSSPLLAGLESAPSVRALWFASSDASETGPEAPFAAVLPAAPASNGRIVLLGGDHFLDNAELEKRDHALLAVRLIEELAPRGLVLFDEHALGSFETETALGLAFSRRLLPASLALLAVIVLLAWRAAWPRAFPRDPPALARISPLSRARAQAALLVRAGRHDLVACDLRAAVFARLRERARLAPRHTIPAATEPSDGRPSDPELAAVAARLGADSELDLWRELLRDRPVRRERELDALARELEALEQRALAGAPRPAVSSGRAVPGRTATSAS